MIRECRVYRGAAKNSGSAAGGIVRGNPPQKNKRAVKKEVRADRYPSRTSGDETKE